MYLATICVISTYASIYGALVLTDFTRASASRFVAMIHAALMSTLTLQFLIGLNVSMRDFLNGDPSLALWSCGPNDDVACNSLIQYMYWYLIYDTLISIERGISTEIGLHHSVLIAAFAYQQYYEIAPFFVVIMFVCEISTVFYHLRWFVKDYYPSLDVPLGGIFATLFFMTRVIFMPIMLIDLAACTVKQWSVVSEQDANVHVIVLLCAGVAQVAINLYWFREIVRQVLNFETKPRQA